MNQSQNMDNNRHNRGTFDHGPTLHTVNFAASDWKTGIFFFSSMALKANALRDFSMSECLRGSF